MTLLHDRLITVQINILIGEDRLNVSDLILHTEMFLHLVIALCTPGMYIYHAVLLRNLNLSNVTVRGESSSRT